MRSFLFLNNKSGFKKSMLSFPRKYLFRDSLITKKWFLKWCVSSVQSFTVWIDFYDHLVCRPNLEDFFSFIFPIIQNLNPKLKILIITRITSNNFDHIKKKKIIQVQKISVVFGLIKKISVHSSVIGYFKSQVLFI